MLAHRIKLEEINGSTFLFSESMRISSSSSFLSIVVRAAGSGGVDITAAGEVGETAASDSSPSCVSQENHQF